MIAPGRGGRLPLAWLSPKNPQTPGGRVDGIATDR